ncbi:hypothetical protein [Streptomyces alboflavus]|uniref:hypothetical protein n=1 Tax=Streptomyces alboflavus TaxID=67267 RepID=UPI0012FF3E85|nr:hypothetical protein [Streptomyces alboflavus]
MHGDKLIAVLNSWLGQEKRCREVRDPSVAEIHELLDALDGSVCTELSISRGEESLEYLGIGGGPQRFLVAGELESGELLQLQSESGEGREQEVVLDVGGQEGKFSQADLVDKEAARWAVEQFVNEFPQGLGHPWDVS